MLIAVYIFCLVFGLGIGYLIRQAVNSRCKHNWKLLEGNKVFRVRGARKDHTGYIKFYECDHCKKMKKEQIELDDLD